MPAGEPRVGVPQAERAPMPETSAEQEPQREAAPAADLSSAVNANAMPAPAAPKVIVPKSPALPVTKDELRMRVERVLEENLWDLYFGMPKEQRLKFRAAGEVVAGQMRAMLDQAKIKPSEVHTKIDHWLRTIPKVNHWFLLQEGKIKTDNVLAIAREQHPAIE